jgi:2-polyprenyl-3-methyl-5-hydroxy-6-metoxy-1,4-benzoquinol methylase
MLTCAAEGGYEVEGIELAPSATTISSQSGILVHTTRLAECGPELRSSPYGVISYFHVLEHVSDPVTEVVTARQWLSAGGILVVEAPFFGTLSWGLMRHHHRHCYRMHRSYFNPRSSQNCWVEMAIPCSGGKRFRTS